MHNKAHTRSWLGRFFDHGTKAPPATADFLYQPGPEPRQFGDVHDAGILTVAFSPDGRHALSGSMDSTVKLIDLGSGELVRSFEGHDGNVHAVAVSPDGNSLLSASYDTTVRHWSIRHGRRPLHVFDGHLEAVHSVAFSPNGKRVLSGGSDNALLLWSLTRGELIRSFEGHTSAVNSVAVSPDGRLALSGSRDKRLRLWGMEDGTTVASLIAHKSPINAVAYSPNGRHFASGALDGTVQIRDSATHEPFRSYRLTEGDNPVTSLCYSPDSEWLLATTFDRFRSRGEVSLLNVAGQGRRVMHEVIMAHILNGTDHIHPDIDLITSIAFSPDGYWALGGTMEGTLILWPLEAVYQIFMQLQPAPGTH